MKCIFDLLRKCGTKCMEESLETALRNLALKMDNCHVITVRRLSFSFCWLSRRDLSKRQPQPAMAPPSRIGDHLTDMISRVPRVLDPEKLPL